MKVKITINKKEGIYLKLDDNKILIAKNLKEFNKFMEKLMKQSQDLFLEFGFADGSFYDTIFGSEKEIEEYWDKVDGI